MNLVDKLKEIRKRAALATATFKENKSTAPICIYDAAGTPSTVVVDMPEFIARWTIGPLDELIKEQEKQNDDEQAHKLRLTAEFGQQPPVLTAPPGYVLVDLNEFRAVRNTCPYSAAVMTNPKMGRHDDPLTFLRDLAETLKSTSADHEYLSKRVGQLEAERTMIRAFFGAS